MHKNRVNKKKEHPSNVLKYRFELFDQIAIFVFK